MTIVIFTDAGGVPWKVWKAASQLIFHAKTGTRKTLPIAEVDVPDLRILSEEPRTLEALCRQATEEAA